ncbi:MAG: PAS domain S-box protein [Desulfobacteraceae bacterium]|nr:PAS domain S-box protein [Desulfobacteraceae bacterium]
MSEDHANKIMVVDDEVVIALRLQQRLTTMGFDITGVAHSGEEAVEKARRLRPDLILMDIMIPGKLDGIAAAKIVKDELGIPVVFLTAFSEDNIIDRAKQAEPYGYILKPFQDREIKAAVEIALYKNKMEKALRESDKKFKDFLNNLGDAAYEADAFGNITYTNKAAEALTGLPLNKIIGTPFLPLFTEKSKKIAVDVHQRTLNGESPEFELTFNNGKIARFKNEPLVDKDGKIIGAFGVARDITCHKQTEEALKKSEERYRALAENSRVGFWQTTLDGHTIYINPAMHQMLEIEESEELHGKTYHSFYNAKNQEIIKRELAKREKGLSSTYEVELIGKKGTQRNVMISGAPIFLSEDKIHSAIGTFTDITDKKRAEKALIKARDELEIRVKERTVELNNALKTVKRSEKKLSQRKLSLEKVNKELLETNQAVSVLARNIDKKKEELEKKYFRLCNSKLIPILKGLQKDVYCQKREADLELIINYLNEITCDSPLHHDIDTHLTDQEMRVAMMIKNGMTSQQIGDLLCISLHTVKTHRKNIRKKLKIDNTDINLVSYLKSKMKAQD